MHVLTMPANDNTPLAVPPGIPPSASVLPLLAIALTLLLGSATMAVYLSLDGRWERGAAPKRCETVSDIIDGEACARASLRRRSIAARTEAVPRAPSPVLAGGI